MRCDFAQCGGATVLYLLLAVTGPVRITAVPGSSSPAQSAIQSDDQFARDLLTDWLVRRDLGAVRARIAPDFFLHPVLRDRDEWPASIRQLPDAERALRFPFACEYAKATCPRLADCARAMHGGGDFEVERHIVDADMIGANPELRTRAGHTMILVSLIVKGCNVGAALSIDDNDSRRIVSIFYVVG